MATVTGTLKLFDAISGPLRSITQGMNLLVSSMESMQNATSRNADVDKKLTAAKKRIAAAEAEITRQIEQAKRQQDRFNASVQSGNSRMMELGTAVIAVNQGLELAQKTWSGINSTMNLSDRVNSANARLALINDGTRTQLELQKSVLSVADKTRASFFDTADLITKIGAGTQGVFKNNDEMLAFAEQFNKTLVVSGATAVDASIAILQMSQALGSGVLQGDELRSISEAAPALMRVLADGLGVARGELKAMGADGKLTSDKIVAAFANQSDRINEMFETFPMTFGGAMTILKNRFIEWYGTISAADGPLTAITNQVMALVSYLQSADGQQFFNGLASGISTAVAWLISMVQTIGQIYNFFVNNWSIIEPIVWGIVGAFAAWKAITMTVNAIMAVSATIQAVQGAATMLATGATIAQTAAQWGLNAALLASPITWIILAIIAFIAIIVVLVKHIIKLWNTNDEFAAGFMRVWNSILNFFDSVPGYFWTVVEAIAKAFVWMAESVGGIFDAVINSIIDSINTVIGLINNLTGSSYEMAGTFSFENVANAALDYAGAKKEEAYNTAAAKAAEREAKVVAMINDRAAKRQEEAANKNESANGEKVKGSMFDPTNPVNAGGKDPNIGKVKEVGKIKNKVDISSEDLKVMRDLAEMKSIQNFVSLTPTVQVTTGDINQGADIDTIINGISRKLETEFVSTAQGVYT